MATGARLSIIGLYHMDHDILTDMLDYLPSIGRITNPELPLIIPETDFDGQQVIDRIMIDCAELEIMPADPEYFRHVLRVWCKNRQPIWQRFWETTIYQYNPIWNKDGTITDTDTTTFGKIVTRKNNMKQTGTVKTDGEQTDEGTAQRDVAGYNSADFVPSEKQTYKNMSTPNITETRDLTDDATNTDTDSGQETHKIERVEKGNIGVTTTQAMIREERELISADTVSFIVNDFKSYFCLLVY